MNNSNVSLTVPAQPEYLDIIRLTLYSLASKVGFSFEEIEDMKVAVAEACNNVILHAYTGRKAGTVHLRFKLAEHELAIHVKDEGNSFNHEHIAHQAVSLHDQELSEAKVGGLGIFMMQALMDDVQVHKDGGTEVVLTKRLSRNEEMA